jgi:alpha-2-macroglobulin
VVNLQNLFGTPAQNRRVVGELALAPSYPSFYALKEWNFHDPMHSKKSFSEKLGEQQTDAEGNAVFDLGLEKFDSASFLMRFIAEGFEPDGGRSVLASSTVLISPLQHLVGYKAQGDLNFIKKGTQIGVDWIAVDPDLNKIAVPDLTLKTIEFRQISTLVKQANGTYKYESVKKEYVNKSESFSISAAPTPFMLPTSIPGDFAIAITDTKGVELNRVPFRVSGEANLTFELEKNTELKIALNKSDYDPGEEIEISIQAPYSGAGLITIEKERLYAHKWFKTDSNSTIQRIAIPSELEGNGYINVTFVRSLASDEIFMSPMSTGVAPFSISKASRINKIDLALPPLVRPGKDLAITLSAQKPGKAVVFAVDEGILQVAKYINPDPLNSFYKKRALEVETRQILNLILPEFSKLQMRRSSEAGGAASLLGKNLNPFKRKGDKPVAYWSGLIDVGPEPQTLTYTVPDYFAGQLRVIAVAVSQLAMDAASDKTIVKGHFVLMPNVPNFVAPGDQLKISVGVSNQAKNSGAGAEVQLDLSTSKNIDPIGAKSSALTIDEGSEGSAGFDLKVKEPLGNATLSFVASHGDKTSRRTVTTSVRPAMPYISMIKAGYVDAGKAVQVPAQRNMFAAHRTNEISVSKLPLSMARNFAAYLRKYPYGCTEQLVSKGFPAIVLAPYTDFGIPTNKAADQVQGIAEILASRQLPDGGFIKWPGHPHINVFHTAYAVHYLTEAKDRGYRIPNHLMRDALAYLKEYAEREPEQLEMARVQAYGAYLLCRNGINATQALTAIEKWLDGYEDKAWVKDIMVLFMASAYKIMNANDKAWKLLDQFDATAKMAPEYHHGVFDDTIKQAMRLFLLSTHFPERLDEFKGDDLNSLVTSLSASFNTTSSALALLAFEAYGKHVDAPSNDGIDVQQTIDDQKSALALEGTLFPKAAVDAGIQSIKITNDTDAVLFYALTQAGFDSEPSVNKQTNGIEIFKEFVNNDGDVVQKATIGEELTVRIKGRTVSGADAWNVAIVDLLPGGFEVVLDSIDRRAGHVEYVDVREDRVLVFGNFSERVAVYEYKIKAVNRGTYTVPPIYAESMYNRQLWAKGITKKIVVE